MAGGDNGVITAWPGKDHREETICPDEKRMITAVAYSPNGVHLGIGTDAGGIHLWDTSKKQLVHTIPAQSGRSTVSMPAFPDDFFAFSPEGAHLAIAVKAAHTVEILNTDDWKLAKKLEHKDPVLSVAWAPDGCRVATGTRSGAVLWNTDSESVLHRFEDLGPTLCVAFSPDSSLLATESHGTRGIEIWDLNNPRRIAALTAHTEPSGDNHSILFSPDGRWLATAGYDARVILWDVTTWEPVHVLMGHRAIVVDLAFTRDSARLASSGLDNQCVLWETETGQQLATFPGFAIDFSPDDSVLATGGRWTAYDETPDGRVSTVNLLRAGIVTESKK